MRSYLTARFFVLIAAWQLVGTLGVLHAPFIVLYLALVPVLALLAIIDRRGIAAAPFREAVIAGAATPELGQRVVVTVQAAAGPEASEASLNRLEARVPESRRIKFDGRRARLVPERRLSDLFFTGTFEGTAHRLGFEEIQRVTFLIHSRWGLWMRPLTVEVPPLSYRVVPALHPVPEQVFSELVARQRLLFLGSRVLTRGRTADQFYSVRKYMYPDPVRHIDQKKTAKYGELMTRTYDTFHSHHLILALDLGRAMCGQLVGSSKHDFYLSACLNLARNALRSGDRVSFFAFSQKVHLQIRQAREVRSFQRLFRGEDTLTAREEDSNYALLNSVIPRLAGQRSIVLVLSDFSKPYVQESLAQHIPELARSHLTVALGLIDRQYDLQAHVLRLSPQALDRKQQASLLYSYWLQEQFEIFSRELATFGSGALRVSDEYWMSTVVRVYALLRSSLRV